MKIKLDENMPLRLASALCSMGHDADTVFGEKLSGARDDEVWTATQKERRLLITQDLDFSDNREFRPGRHCGIVLIRLRSPGRQALFHKVTEVFRTENVDTWTGCIVVVTDRKIRIHRAAGK